MTRYLKLLLPFFLFVVIAPFTPLVDLEISGYFYVPVTGEKGHFFENGVTEFLFLYGEEIGFFVGALSVCIFLLSFLISKWKKLRLGALVMIISLVLGAGILVNGVFKQYWGRPRPRETVAFGGKHAFRPFYKPDFHTGNDPQKSFPSGHVAIGFYYLTLCVLGMRYRSLSLFWIGFALTVIFGGGLFVARIVQGAHYFSDTLAAAIIMWYVALFSDWLVHRFGSK